VVNLEIDWQEQTIRIWEGTRPLIMGALELGRGPPSYPEQYHEVFSEEVFRILPPRWRWDHLITLTEGAVPPWGRCYPLSKNETTALKDFISTNLELGKIRPSSSPFASPFFFRRKPDMEELQGIQDYQCLNEVTVKD
jgi:hypothetical protein